MQFIENPNFKVMNIILATNNWFTLDEIKELLEKQDVNDISKDTILSALRRYVDNGIIEQQFKKYRLTDYYRMEMFND